MTPHPVQEWRPPAGDDGFEPVSAYAVRYVDVLTATDAAGVRHAAMSAGLRRRAADRCDEWIPAARDRAGLAPTLPRLCDQLHAANLRYWRLAVEHALPKVLRYRPGHYAPDHVDMFPGSMRRKLSLVVQLSSPDAYTGGDLELHLNGDVWYRVPRELGTAVVFPAWTRHRVTPVESGERWTLALWGYGPPVR